MTIHEEIQELIPAFVLGACDEQERQRVEQHVASCINCAHVLDEFQPLAAELALAAPQFSPAPDLKSRVMDNALRPMAAPAAQKRRVIKQPGWFARLWSGTALLAGAAAVALILVVGTLWQVNNEMARQRDLISVIAYAQGSAVTIRGTDAAPGATGRLYVDTDSNVAALVTANMPTLPAGRVYQLWLTEPSGTRISGGLFSIDESGNGLLLVRAPSRFASFVRVGVTVEPQGGSPGPTSPPILQAQLAQ